MAYININSYSNKFDMLKNSVTEYIDTQMISKTKLNDTFLHALCHLKDISNPYGLDRSSQGGGILVYIRDTILSILVKQHLSNSSKGLDKLNSKYDNILIIADLNTEMSEPSLNLFFKPVI